MLDPTSKLPVVAFDTETFLIEPGVLAPRIVCVTWRFLDDVQRIDYPKEYHQEGKVQIAANADWEHLREVCHELVSGKYKVAGQNIAFDLAVIANNFPETIDPIFALYDKNLVHDTKIVSQMAHIASGWLRFGPDGKPPKFSLDAISQRLLNRKVEGKKGDDIWRLRYSELDGIPVSEWPEGHEEVKYEYDREAPDSVRVDRTRIPGPLEYALDDTDITAEVTKVQLPSCPNIPTLDLQVRAAWALHLMSCWGVTTDPVMVEELGTKLRKQLSDLNARLAKAGLVRKNGTKDMSAIRARVEKVYAKLGKKAPLTKGKATKTDRRTLEESGDGALRAIAKVGELSKLAKTFVPVLEQGVETAINARFSVLVASGRASCSKPNLMQLPRKGGVRECFVPRPGHVYIAADYHVAELCSLAEVLLEVVGQSQMAEALNAGRDLHIQTAATMLGRDYDTVYAAYKNGDPEAKDARQTSKILNFGLPGGLSAGGLMRYAEGFGLKLDFQEANWYRNLWFNTYPEMKAYFDWISGQAGFGGFTSHHPITGYVRGDVGFTDGANQMFQHLTATGAKEAGWLLSKECYVVEDSPLYDSRPVVFVHDEYILEAPVETAPEAAKRVEALMEEGMGRYLTRVKCRAEAHLMDRWYKEAGPVYGDDGRLRVWTP